MSGEPEDGRGWRGRLILFTVSMLALATLFAVAAEGRWARDRVFWVGMGVFLAVLTLAKPWWFWDNYRARWLRNLVGDEVTTVLYLTLAVMLMAVGVLTEMPFGRG
jgi:hypothetical protein